MCHSVDSRWPFLKDAVSENRISIKVTLRRMTFLLDPGGSWVFWKAPGAGVIGDPVLLRVGWADPPPGAFGARVHRTDPWLCSATSVSSTE